ncbi:hypothetical protein FRB97_000573 [Tulasnella sp. 331]|nr:hypothetical protein FRB97_000573 [Tulasnella sp. 331]
MRRAAIWTSETVLRSSRRTVQRHTSSTGLGLGASQPQQRRQLHQLQESPYAISHGMGEFMSPETLNVVATDYQKGLLDRLNEETKDTELQGQSVWRQVRELAERRDKVLAFNYASQALNNSFFLDMLKAPDPSTPPPVGTQGHEHGIAQRERFAGQINADFGSLTGLKSAFSAAAMGMMGSGWVWLVFDTKGRLAVTATYGAGTMLMRSREQRGPNEWVLGAPPPPPPTSSSRSFSATPISKNAQRSNFLTQNNSPSSGTRLSRDNNPNAMKSSRPISDYSNMNAFRATSKGLTRPYDGPTPGGLLSPLFTCSIHEHCWLRDHGIWGKEAYLQSFWDVVDWKKAGAIWSEFHSIKRDYGA